MDQFIQFLEPSCAGHTLCGSWLCHISSEGGTAHIFLPFELGYDHVACSDHWEVDRHDGVPVFWADISDSIEHPVSFLLQQFVMTRMPIQRSFSEDNETLQVHPRPGVKASRPVAWHRGAPNHHSCDEKRKTCLLMQNYGDNFTSLINHWLWHLMTTAWIDQDTGTVR